MPPRVDIRDSDRVNPFFEVQDILLGIKSDDKQALNYLISQFDSKFDNFLNENFTQIYNRKTLSLGFRFANDINNELKTVSNKYYKTYVKYKLAYLEYLAFSQNSSHIKKKIFRN